MTCLKTILLFSTFLFFLPLSALAFKASEVVVVANSRVKGSVHLARYYMQRRGIPEANLLKVRTTADESCSRQEYDADLRQPIKKKITALQREQGIRAIVLLYGVPLKIRPVDNTRQEKREIKRLEAHLEDLFRQKDSVAKKEQEMLAQETRRAKLQLSLLRRTDTRAAVDSELALVLAGEYNLEGWLPNPYFLGYKDSKAGIARHEVLLVARLDGPEPAVVRRIIDDAIAVETKGLQGQACFDARWQKPTQVQLQGYRLYDNSIHSAADLLRRSGRIAVTIDQEDRLFQEGECSGAALYCGWYSLGQYVDAFEWVQGSIGYHIASEECSTLREKNSSVWCKRMLEQGITATIGPVYEPFVQGFPLPDIFFPRLSEGNLSLGETYLISLPYLSWQMVLVGDPLYRPFLPKDATRPD